VAEFCIASMMRFSPGSLERLLSGRSTRKVRSTETLGTEGLRLSSELSTTTKSSWFQEILM